MRVQLDRSAIKRAARDAVLSSVRRNASGVGEVIVSQVQQRFDRGGDEQIRWPGLWASDASRVAKVTGGAQADAARAKEVRLAKSNLERTEAKIKAGDIAVSKAGSRRRRARSRLSMAKTVARAGSAPVFRAGGEPLRDVGTLRASYTYAVANRSSGVEVVIGSPDPRADWHHRGFKTSGRNYVPLSKRARRGWSKNLVPGYDYVILNGVTVPARPQLRLTRRNVVDIRRSAAGL